jgi:hypothetical protein
MQPRIKPTRCTSSTVGTRANCGRSHARFPTWDSASPAQCHWSDSWTRACDALGASTTIIELSHAWGRRRDTDSPKALDCCEDHSSGGDLREREAHPLLWGGHASRAAIFAAVQSLRRSHCGNSPLATGPAAGAHRSGNPRGSGTPLARPPQAQILRATKSGWGL